MPMRDDYLAVGELTDTYFEGYMIGRYQSSSQADLVKFETTINMTFFMFGEPALIEYESTAYFSASSSVTPRQSVLDSVLMEALDQPEPYTDLLAGLGSGNPFSSTTFVEFKEPQTRVVSGKSTPSDSNANTATFAAAAAGLTLLIAGAVLYRRNKDDDTGDYFGEKDFGKNGGGDAATLAGDTYAGDTYDGSISMGRSTYLAGDEERGGMINVDLENSEEDYCDDSSIAPVWDDETSRAVEKAPVIDQSALDEKCSDKARRLEKANSSEEQTTGSRYLDNPILGLDLRQTKSADGISPENETSSIDTGLKGIKVGGQTQCDHSSSEEMATRNHESLPTSVDRTADDTEQEPFSINDFDEFLERSSDASLTSPSGSFQDFEDSSSKRESEYSNNRPLSVAEIETLLESDF
jgi:hypothetical protein